MVMHEEVHQGEFLIMCNLSFKLGEGNGYRVSK